MSLGLRYRSFGARRQRIENSPGHRYRGAITGSKFNADNRLPPWKGAKALLQSMGYSPWLMQGYRWETTPPGRWCPILVSKMDPSTRRPRTGDRGSALVRWVRWTPARRFEVSSGAGVPRKNVIAFAVAGLRAKQRRGRVETADRRRPSGVGAGAAS
jgi:hypothetical protein